MCNYCSLTAPCSSSALQILHLLNFQVFADAASKNRDVTPTLQMHWILFISRKGQFGFIGHICWWTLCSLPFFSSLFFLFFFLSPPPSFTRRKVCLLAARSGWDRNVMHAQTAQYFLFNCRSKPRRWENLQIEQLSPCSNNEEMLPLLKCFDFFFCVCFFTENVFFKVNLHGALLL